MKLFERPFSIGSWINSGSPIVAEVMSACGYDFLVLDAEHSAIDFQDVQQMLQAIRAGNPACVSFVRMPGNRYADTKRYLDAGATGVICPMINTPEEARELVRACKVPPLGGRGVGYSRSFAYGHDFERRVAAANEQTLVGIQIEHIDAVANLPAILAVPGIDFMMVGPYDLSASMGVTGQFDDPDYRAALARIQAACQAANIPSGMHVVQSSEAQLRAAIAAGYRFIVYSLDITILATHSRQMLAAMRSTTPTNQGAHP